MAIILNDYYGGKRQIVNIFANTGKEREETLEFVDKCDKKYRLNLVYVEPVINPEMGKGTTHKVVDFYSCSRNGEPYEEMIKKYGIPNKAFPHCTRELKRRPIHSYVKNFLGLKTYDTAIGIRADETHRINLKESAIRRYIYPLSDYGITKKEVEDFWKNQDFTLNLREHEGNCDLCWKKSDKKLVTLIRNNPKSIKWWRDMEKKYSDKEFGKRSKKTRTHILF